MERPFTVAIDSREQKPYHWEGVKCKTVTLATGDYSIVGMESVVSVERKSYADFCGCLADGRERFENALHRLAAIRYPLVVIEADMRNLLEPHTYVDFGGIERTSQFGLLAAQNSLLSWQARYRIPMLLCGERSAGARMTIQHLDTIWRLEREDAAQARRDARG